MCTAGLVLFSIIASNLLNSLWCSWCGRQPSITETAFDPRSPRSIPTVDCGGANINQSTREFSEREINAPEQTHAYLARLMIIYRRIIRTMWVYRYTDT